MLRRLAGIKKARQESAQHVVVVNIRIMCIKFYCVVPSCYVRLLIFIDAFLYCSDICISNKKVFAHEHALYTARQLERHYKVGDQNVESGFKGHPKCEFCDIVFYDNDQLYVHCRDRHEECYLCARNGIRHAYYENYDLLVRMNR